MQQSLFDFFGELDPPEHLFLPLRSVMVEKADCFPSQQLLKVYVSSDHLINSALFKEAEDFVVDQMFPGQGIRIRVIPSFHLNRSLTALEALELYHENILWELYNQKKDIPSYLLYKDATLQQTEKGVVIGVDNPFMADLRGNGLKEFIQNLLSERFGIEVRVTIEVQEDPEVKRELLRKMEAERKQAILDSVTQVSAQNPVREKPANSEKRQKKALSSI